MIKTPGEPTLADVRREFPQWRCWRGISGLCHARRTDTPAASNPPSLAVAL